MVADWLELQLLAGRGRVLTSTNVRRARTIAEDSEREPTDYDDLLDELVDSEIADLESEQLVSEVAAELQWRAETIGESYPFEFEAEGSDWALSLKREGSASYIFAGRITYLICLVISAIKDVLIDRKEDPEVQKAERDAAEVLQILACIAAAQLIGGRSYWMGSPRPDSTTKMRAALERLVLELGYGKLKTDDPEWTTGHENDGTVDLIAWRPLPDRRWAVPLLFGQVASGSNWKSKPISLGIQGYFFDWFTDAPGQTGMHCLSAIFIPFNLHRDARADARHSHDEKAAGFARRTFRDFGIVVDRARFAYLVEDRLRSQADEYAESHRKFAIRWLSSALKLL